MAQGVLSFLILVPSFIVGMGVVSSYWLIVPALSIFSKAVLSIGEAVPGQDFRNIPSHEFREAQKGINILAFGLFLLAAISFGFGKFVSWIFI